MKKERFVMPLDATRQDRYALQMLARHQMIERLLCDVRFDMEVCKLEGWDFREFPRMARNAIPEDWCS